MFLISLANLALKIKLEAPDTKKSYKKIYVKEMCCAT